ncbi:Utp14 protein-domain-containing protein [Infundibulicybe gibba]|nr:Utp14 protein-domain-containing protein [Infundibulicybe gibba]
MAKVAKNNNRGAGRSSSSSQKSRLSGTKANAAGYAKRQSRKAKSLHGLQTPSDVYEYAQEKTRRSKIHLDLDRDEAAEFGVGTGGDNAPEVDQGDVRARLIGENEGDELDSGDDEEIDSDAARFAGFFSNRVKKSKPKKARPTVHFEEVDLDEDEPMHAEQDEEEQDSEDESEDEGMDGDELIDILDILDGKGEADMDSDSGERKSEAKPHEPSLPSAEGDNEDEAEDVTPTPSEGDSDEGDSDQHSEDDDGDMPHDADPSALDSLQDFISTLDPTAKKRKADELPLPEPKQRHKRRLMKERTEAGAENEFRAQASGARLNLEDLLAPLASTSQATLQSLKQSTSALLPTSSKTKAQTLSAPLPQRTQERLDREAAYEQTKQEVDKWSGTMKRIKEPTTDLETSIDRLLKSAKMRDEDIAQTEETILKTNNVSVEEIAQRRGELRKMRELMFRAEIKARRIGKIKSKTARETRRERGRDEDEDDEEGRLKREVERARERATLKHRHNGKWARGMRGKDFDEEEGGRREVEEMLEQGERLRRRIKGVGSDDDSEDGNSGSEVGDDGNEEGVDKIKQSAFEELKRVEAGDDEDAEGSKKKGIFEMKFMKDAMARQQAGADRMMDDFVKEMGGHLEHDSDAEEYIDNTDPAGVVVHRAGGRVTYRPGAVNSYRPARPLGSLASDTSSVTLKSTDLLSPPPISPQPDCSERTSVPLPEANPWLAPPSSTGKVSRKSNEVIVDKESGSIEKSKNKLRKLARKREEERLKAKADAAVEISADNVLRLDGSSVANARDKPRKKDTSSKNSGDVDEEDSNSEREEQEKMLKEKSQGKGPKAFEQRDLVALAFAGDNVVQDFEEVKRREIAADAPREVDTTIPGWGSWGGTGTHRAPPKPYLIKKVAGIDPTTRADHNKSHVIISEKRDRKAAKYLVKDLPYPYTSKAQFERSMGQPLGTEWNTRVGFQRGTLPRVVKKPGAIINPLEKLA